MIARVRFFTFSSNLVGAQFTGLDIRANSVAIESLFAGEGVLILIIYKYF